MKWSQVIEDRRYKNASPQKKRAIRESWYEKKIKAHPKYSPEQDEKIRRGLFGKGYERAGGYAGSGGSFALDASELAAKIPTKAEWQTAVGTPKKEDLFKGKYALPTGERYGPSVRKRPKLSEFLRSMYREEGPIFQYEYEPRDDGSLDIKQIGKVAVETAEDIMDVIALPYVLGKTLLEGGKELRDIYRYYHTKVPTELEYYSKFTIKELEEISKHKKENLLVEATRGVQEQIKNLPKSSPTYKEGQQFINKIRNHRINFEKLSQGTMERIATEIVKQPLGPVQPGKHLVSAKPTPPTPQVAGEGARITTIAARGIKQVDKLTPTKIVKPVGVPAPNLGRAKAIVEPVSYTHLTLPTKRIV